jgi:galactose mutarotase-like enzyme
MRIYGGRFHGCRADEYVWRGHRLVCMENELLRIGVVASKGADIIELRYKSLDLDVLWHAPQPFCPPGQHVPSIGSKEGSFMDYYSGGWQEAFPNGTIAAEYRGAEIGVHGEIALLPWDVQVREDTAQRIEIEFSVETFRTPFRLERRMILERQSPVLQINESVMNAGEEDEAFMWGHHPAFGPPFLEAGCLIELPPCEISVPDYAEKLNRRFALSSGSQYPYALTLSGKNERADIVKGKDSRTEDVLLLSRFAEGWFAIRNPNLQLAVRLTWDVRVFPYLWCWQLYGGGWGYPYYGRAYALALEPFSSPILTLPECVNAKCAPILCAGKTLASNMQVGIFTIGSNVSP